MYHWQHTYSYGNFCEYPRTKLRVRNRFHYPQILLEDVLVRNLDLEWLRQQLKLTHFQSHHLHYLLAIHGSEFALLTVKNPLYVDLVVFHSLQCHITSKIAPTDQDDDSLQRPLVVVILTHLKPLTLYFQSKWPWQRPHVWLTNFPSTKITTQLPR